MRLIHKKSSKFMNTIVQHIKDNIKAYIFVACILLIGITLGVMFINNLKEQQAQEIQNYINNFLSNLKNGSNIDSGKLFQNSIGSNFLLVLIMWFVGSTVIGIPLVLGIVAFRGFCLGYTVSALIAILGTGKGILFFVTSILLQNLITIPCILALAVSGIKLYKSILKDKRRENIKGEMIRHTLFSIVILMLLIIASLIETYLSSNLFMLCTKYL